MLHLLHLMPFCPLATGFAKKSTPREKISREKFFWEGLP